MFARKLLQKVLGDTTAATAIEYALILSFIVLAMMASLNLIASKTISMWSVVSAKVTNTP
jgi:pilus assembly protein Flp/PilA